MGRKRFLALVMALSMLFTLMAPALTFATGTGSEEETPGAGTSEVTEETNEQGSDTDPDEGDGAGNDAGDTNTGADNTGDTGTGDAGADNTGDTGTGDVDTGDTGTDETGTSDTGTGDVDTGDNGTGDVDTGDTGTSDVNTGDDENTNPAQGSDETDPTNEVLSGEPTNEGDDPQQDDPDSDPDPVGELDDDPAPDPAPKAPATRAFSTDRIAVFFTGSQNWDGSGAIKVHYWKDGTSDDSGHPSLDMKYLFDNGYGKSVYGALIPEDANRIIFNCDSETVTISISSTDNGAWWYATGEWENDKAKVVLASNSYYPAYPATCTTEGNTEYYLLDGHYYDNTLSAIGQADTVATALGHDFGEWVQTTAPRCTTEGEETRTCSRCDAYQTQRVAMLGHDMENCDAQAATCTEIGWNAHQACSRCGYKENYEELPATGHTEAIDAAVAPTCTETGLTEGKHCSACNAVIVAQEVVPATGHNLTTHAAVEPTVQAAGNIAYWSCDRCNKYFSDANAEHEIEAGSWVIPALAVTVVDDENGGFTASIPAGYFTSDETDHEPIVTGEAATIVFNSPAKTAIADAAGENPVSLSVATSTNDGVMTVTIEMTANNAAVFENPGEDAFATVTVPFALGQGMVPVVNLVVNGERTPVEVLDYSDNSVTFRADHFSVYEIAQQVPPCEHKNAYTRYRWADENEKHGYRDVDDNWGHARTGRLYWYAFCPDCNTTIDQGYEENGIWPGTETHDYNSNHVCNLCGHVNTCQHNGDIYTYGENVGETHYEDTGSDAFHQGSIERIITERCSLCYDVVGEPQHSTDTWTDPHDWDENGVCKICYHVNACLHPNAESQVHLLEDPQQTIEEKSGDNLHHWLVGSYYTIMHCPDCGLDYDRQEHANSFQAELQNHVWEKTKDDKIVCSICGHVNTCTHELDARDRVDYLGDTPSYQYVDERYHSVIGTHPVQYSCRDCGLTWEETVQDSYTEEHDYCRYTGQSGHCNSCGHTSGLTLTLNKSSLELKIGETAELAVTVYPSFTQEYEYVYWRLPAYVEAVSLRYSENQEKVTVIAIKEGTTVLQAHAWDGQVVSCTITVVANEQNKAGEDVDWSFDEQTGTLTLSGQGPMYPYNSNYNYLLLPPWNDKAEGIRNLVLSPGITDIPWDALGSWINLESISVKEGEGQYKAEDGVLFTTSGDELVYYPPKHTGTTYTVPEGTTKIGPAAFKGSKLLETVVLPEGLTEVGSSAFQNAQNLSSITFPSTLKRIDDYAFSLCGNLSSFTLPEGLEYIGEGAFYFSLGPKELTIPSTVTRLNRQAFSQCSGIETVHIKANLVYLDYSELQFQFCLGIKTVIMEEGLTAIADGMFLECKNLSSVTIPNSVQTIGFSAFDGCEKLVALPTMNGVETIGSCAFADTGLRGTITIPSSVKYIKGSVFSNCPDITAVTLPEGLLELGGYANTSITSIKIPDSVTSIPYRAFYGCKELAEINIPESVTSIGDSAFYGCSSLMRVVIPDNVESIGKEAFSKCASLQTLTLPTSLKTFGEAKSLNQLQTVNYAGTKEQKNAVIMDWPARFELRKATWVYTYTNYNNVSVSENEKLTTVGVDNSTAASTNVNLPADIFDTSIEEQKPVAIQAQTAQITFDSTAANAIAGNAGTTDLSLELTAEEGTNSVKTLNIELKAGGEAVYANNIAAGSATVTVPVDLDQGTTVDIYLIVAGERTHIATAEVDADHTITFSVEHFSEYEITRQLPYVAQIGANKYETLAAAFAAAADGDTIKLLADAAITATQVIDKNLTLDLNGHNITATNARALWVKSGEVTITGTGTVSTTGCTTLDASSSVIRVGNSDAGKAKLTIGKDVTVSTEYCYGVTAFGTNADGVELVVNGTVAVTGAEAAVSGNGNSGNKGAVTINEGAVVSAANSAAVYHPQGDKLTISGGTITGKTAVYVKSGTVSITDGILRGTGDAAAYSFNGNGGNPTGDALVVDNCNYPGGAPTVTISGGAFESSNAKGIGSYAGNSMTELASVTSNNDTISIPEDEKWVAKGTNPETYDLVKKEYVAQIGETKYETLAEAFAAARPGDTVKILTSNTATTAEANVTLPYQTAGEYTLDLNGKDYYIAYGFKLPDITKAGITYVITDNSFEDESPVYTASSKPGGTLHSTGILLGKVDGSNSSLNKNKVTLQLDKGNIHCAGINPGGNLTIGVIGGKKGGNGNIDFIMNNGSFVADTGNVFRTINGSITVENGYLESKSTVIRESSYTTIRGGIFVGHGNEDPGATHELHLGAVFANNRCHLTLTGGSFTNNHNDNFNSNYLVHQNNDTGLVDGKAYVAVQEGNWWVIREAAAAVVTDTKTTHYATLAEAIAAAQDDDTVKLLADAAITATQVIDKNLTLDLNGHNITATNARALWVKSGEVTITGTGTVSTTGCTTLDASSSVIRVGNSDAGKAKLTIGKDVTVSTEYCYGVTAFGTNADGVELVVNGTVAVTGAEAAVSGNGNSGNKGAVTINEGAVVSAANSAAVYHPQGDKLTISGGTITGKTAVYVKSGTVSITDGILRGTGDAAAYSFNGNGGNPTGDALVVDNCNYPGGAPTVTISGGAFESSNAKGIGSYAGNSMTELASVTSNNDTISIPEDEKWVAKGTNPETYDLVKKEYVAQIGETKYETLESAITAAGSNDTITLLADVTGEFEVAAGKAVVLDLNGKTITSVGDTLTVRGTLTVNDSSKTEQTAGTGKIIGKWPVNVIGGTLVFNEGIVEAQEMAGWFSTGSTVTINGGSFSSADNTVLGTPGNEGKGGNTITVNGGTFNGNISAAGYIACGIYAANNDTWTISGGTFNINGGAGIVVRAGTVNLNGGSFTTSGNTTGKVGDAGNAVPCSAVVLDVKAGYPGAAGTDQITIGNATLTTASGVDAIAVLEDANHSYVDGSIKATSNALTVPADYKWVEGDTAGTYKLVEAVVVTFYLNGGQIVIDNETVTESFTQTVANGATAIEPNPAPTNGNQDFAGWFSDEQLSTPYNFDDPVTTAITLYAKWTTNGTCIVGKSIELNDSIRINVRLSKLSDEQHREYYHIRATFNGSTTVNGNLADLLASGVAVIRDGRYVIPVADTISYQITDLVHVVVSYGVDENNLTPIDEFDYSVQTYCENMISLHPSDAKLVAVCTATLDYGAYSQIQFNYKTENLANANYTAGAETISAIQIPDTYGITSISGTCTGIAGSGRSINLLSATEIRFTFRPENVSTLDNYTFTVNGEPATATVNGNKFMVKVTGVKAPLLDTQYTVVITNTTDGTSMTATYSVLAYAYNMQSNSNANVSNMCKALYRYFDTAKKYFLA